MYFKEHYKHEKSLCHLPIPKQEKQNIAGKLLQGVEEKRILQDTRFSLSKAIEPKHLITRKDLQNIKRDFGLNINSKGLVLADDETSVCSWVNKMSQMEFNPVMMYKRQGKKYANVNANDFILAIMTEFQKKMLMEFGSDRICVDSTHGISAYGFELVTLLVVDKYEEGIPVNFLISSTISEKNFGELF